MTDAENDTKAKAYAELCAAIGERHFLIAQLSATPAGSPIRNPNSCKRCRVSIRKCSAMRPSSKPAMPA